MMQTQELVAHPAFPPAGVSSIAARVIGRDQNWLRVRWRIEGSQKLVIPAFAGRGRADELWQTTCFEMFLKPTGGSAYCEFNLSPSERWAAYDFAAYREGMAERPMPREPDCTLRRGSSFTIFDAAVPAAGLPQAECAMALAAVVEEEGGVKSYWGLLNPNPDKPDFHHEDCFALDLPAPEAL